MSNSNMIREYTDSFNRPADTNNYADNDLVANSVTAGSVEPLAFQLGTGNGKGASILSARLQKSGVAVTGATFELHLFKTSPTSTAGDNEAFATTTVNTADFIGTIAFPAMAAYTNDALAIRKLGDGASDTMTNSFQVPANGVIYGLIQCGAAYTDEASGETFTATIVVEHTP